jgi:rare lipoprotein A
MRLSVDAGNRFLFLGLTSAALAGCGLIRDYDRPHSLAASTPIDTTGPAADYPMVLGEPFTVEGELYTPADTLNYDVVGYAAIDEGAGVTLAHRTLPLPSYAEVTSLVTGKTILARIERRGPMTGNELIALSPTAAALLGEGEGAAIRLRRVNPPEGDRAELRAGRAASERIETPRSLVEVLRRKLPETGAASLRAPVQSSGKVLAAAPPQVVEPDSAAIARREPAPEPVVADRVAPSAVARDDSGLKYPSQAERVGAGYVVQAATFANRANAEKAAQALGGTITSAGNYHRVRTGPYTTRGQAEAALAKVRDAGYSDARVQTAG